MHICHLGHFYWIYAYVCYHSFWLNVCLYQVFSCFTFPVTTSDVVQFYWLLDHSGFVSIYVSRVRYLHNNRNDCELRLLKEILLRWVAKSTSVARRASLGRYLRQISTQTYHQRFCQVKAEEMPCELEFLDAPVSQPIPAPQMERKVQSTLHCKLCD